VADGPPDEPAVSEEFGLYFARIPLKHQPAHRARQCAAAGLERGAAGRALQLCAGQPAVCGRQVHGRRPARPTPAPCSPASTTPGCWILWRPGTSKAARYLAVANVLERAGARCAFVSTNSITQGEQVGVLWGWLLAQGVHIHFAHRTFSWSNEARGKAAVHCVIVGFGLDRPARQGHLRIRRHQRASPHAVM
jgi:hypothetical protein